MVSKIISKYLSKYVANYMKTSNLNDKSLTYVLRCSCRKKKVKIYFFRVNLKPAGKRKLPFLSLDASALPRVNWRKNLNMALPLLILLAQIRSSAYRVINFNNDNGYFLICSGPSDSFCRYDLSTCPLEPALVSAEQNEIKL